MPENLTGTLTSNDYSSAHISSFIDIRYTSCAVATLKHREQFEPVSFVYIAASTPNALKTFLYGEMIPLLYCTTMMPLPLIVYI